MSFLKKLVRTKSRSRRQSTDSSQHSTPSPPTSPNKALPSTPDDQRGRSTGQLRTHHTDDSVPPVPALSASAAKAASAPRGSSSAEAEAQQQQDPHAAAVSGDVLHDLNHRTHLPTTFRSAGVPTSSTRSHITGDAALVDRLTNVVDSRPGDVQASSPVPPSISMPAFDAFAVPLGPSTLSAGMANEEGVVAGTDKRSGDAHIKNLSSKLEQTSLVDKVSPLTRPSSTVKANRLVSPLDVPDLHPTHNLDAVLAAATIATSSSPSGVQPHISSHAEQNAELLSRIRSSHPIKTPLSPEGQALFGQAGLEVYDLQGRGTVDWIEVVEKPIVREVVKHTEENIYVPKVVSRNVHATHIQYVSSFLDQSSQMLNLPALSSLALSPKIQPIVLPPSLDSEDEMHYFRDTSGNWREIRGRSTADRILAECGLEGQDEIIADWWDDRAVREERAELEALVRGDASASMRGVLSVKRFKQELLMDEGVQFQDPVEEGQVVGQAL